MKPRQPTCHFQKLHLGLGSCKHLQESVIGWGGLANDKHGAKSDEGCAFER